MQRGAPSPCLANTCGTMRNAVWRDLRFSIIAIVWSHGGNGATHVSTYKDAITRGARTAKTKHWLIHHAHFRPSSHTARCVYVLNDPWKFRGNWPFMGFSPRVPGIYLPHHHGTARRMLYLLPNRYVIEGAISKLENERNPSIGIPCNLIKCRARRLH